MIVYPSTKVYFPVNKIKKCLLLPGTKHSQEFFSVGYKPEDDLRLFRDIETQFNRKLAEGFRYDTNSVSYSIVMQLGVTVKKPFLTAWTEDGAAEFPRFVTAHRVTR